MKKILLTILFITILTSGCSYTELNDLAIASAIGVDYIDDEYVLTVQIMNLSNKNESIKEESILYEGKGDSIISAIRSISLKYPKRLYLGHLELMVVGKGMIEKGINNSFDYFFRSPEARNDSMLLISTENNAKEIIDPKEVETASFQSKDLISTVENSTKKNGLVVNRNMEEFISDYLKEGIDPVATNIKIEDNKTFLTGIAIFKGDEYVGTLENNAAIAYNTIKNNFEDIPLNIPIKDSIASVIIMPNSEIEVTKNMNININVKVEVHIIETHEKIDFTKKENINILSETPKKVLKEDIEELLEFCKSKNVDILGIKNIIYKKYNNKYDEIKNINIYKNNKFNINIDTEVYRLGNIDKNSFGGNNE